MLLLLETMAWCLWTLHMNNVPLLLTHLLCSVGLHVTNTPGGSHCPGEFLSISFLLQQVSSAHQQSLGL